MSVPVLAKRAGVAYETARRASQGQHDLSLGSTNKLLEVFGLRINLVREERENGEDLAMPTPLVAPTAQLLRELVPLLSAAGHVKAARAASIQAALLSSE